MADTSEVTIFDVAEAAGVSITTVSRILNNKPGVATATRQRVQQIIEELKFQPHAQAQRLAAGKSQTIALLNPIKYTSISQQELDFFIGASLATGEENFIFNLVTTAVTEDVLLNLFRSTLVDGLILMEVHLQDWRVDLLRKNNYPFVMIGHCANNNGLSFIDLDFENAIVTAVDHLVELGHQHIGLLTFPVDIRQQKYGPAVRILAGLKKAEKKYNLTIFYKEAEMTIPGMSEATRDMLAEYPKLSAFITIKGDMSVGVIRALNTMGKTVPGDFSLVSITTDSIAQLVTPTLTAIDFPTHTIGYKAARMLIRSLKAEPIEMSQILCPPTLIVRESTAPPA